MKFAHLTEIVRLAALQERDWASRMRRIIESGEPVNAGPWSVQNPPVRPGGYVNWRAESQPVIQPNLAGIVCIPFTHDWGPLGVPMLSFSWSEWQGVYGTDDTPGSRAVKQAFFGEGLPGYGGAGAILSYRFGAAAAAAASVALQNTTPAAALTLTAKYPGTRGNNFNVTVRANAADPTKQDLLIFEGTTLLESYTWTSAGAAALAGLAAIINVESSLVTAAVTQDGVPLANVSASTLANGNDGSTLAATDWSTMLDSVQSERFAVFAPFDVTDTSIQASITAWLQGLNGSGKRVDGFIGGPITDTRTTAVTRAQVTNEPNVNTLGIGGVVDFGVVGTPQAPVVLSTSQLAPRVAGIFAARGGIKPLTFARLAGCDFRYQSPTGMVSAAFASDSDIVACLENGVIPISRDSNPTAPLRLEKGLTTWQSTNADPTRPYAVYKNPKFLKVMQDFEMAIVEFAETEVITPGLPLTQATREFVLGRAQQILQTMSDGGLIQPGFSVNFDNTIPSTPQDDFLAITYEWLFTRSVEQVRNTITVG